MKRAQAHRTKGYRAFRRWLVRATVQRLTDYYGKKFEEAFGRAASGDFVQVTLKDGEIDVAIIPREDVYL